MTDHKDSWFFSVSLRENMFLWHLKLIFPQSNTEFSQQRWVQRSITPSAKRTGFFFSIWLESVCQLDFRAHRELVSAEILLFCWQDRHGRPPLWKLHKSFSSVSALGGSIGIFHSWNHSLLFQGSWQRNLGRYFELLHPPNAVGPCDTSKVSSSSSLLEIRTNGTLSLVTASKTHWHQRPPLRCALMLESHLRVGRVVIDW